MKIMKIRNYFFKDILYMTAFCLFFCLFWTHFLIKFDKYLRNIIFFCNQKMNFFSLTQVLDILKPRDSLDVLIYRRTILLWQPKELMFIFCYQMQLIFITRLFKAYDLLQAIMKNKYRETIYIKIKRIKNILLKFKIEGYVSSSF